MIRASEADVGPAHRASPQAAAALFVAGVETRGLRRVPSVVSSTVAAGKPSLSVVVPLHDEEEVVATFAGRLARVLDEMGGTWEAILVDDGSSDRTYDGCLALHRRDDRFKVVRLSRNFGHQIALTARLELAAGDATVTMTRTSSIRPMSSRNSLPAGVAAHWSFTLLWRSARASRRSRTSAHARSTERSTGWQLSTSRRVRAISGSSIERPWTRCVRCPRRTGTCVGCSAGSVSSRPVSRT